MIAVCTRHEVQGCELGDDEEWRKLQVEIMMRHLKESRPNDEALLEGQVIMLQWDRTWRMNKYYITRYIVAVDSTD